jgi:hypothetical protein
MPIICFPLVGQTQTAKSATEGVSVLWLANSVVQWWDRSCSRLMKALIVASIFAWFIAGTPAAYLGHVVHLPLWTSQDIVFGIHILTDL